MNQVWYPCGSLKGDQRSKSLVESWRDNALFLKDQYKVGSIVCLTGDQSALRVSGWVWRNWAKNGADFWIFCCCHTPSR